MGFAARRIIATVAVVSALGGACAPRDTPHASVNTARITEGALEDFAVTAPSVLAMTDPEVDLGSGDPAIDHLVVALAVTEATGRCIVTHAGEALPPNPFAQLRFAGLYTENRARLARAVAACTDETELAGQLATADPLLRACISELADPIAASLVGAAVAASAVADLTATWVDWMPAARSCAGTATPAPTTGLDPLATSTTPEQRLQSLLDAPDGWEILAIDPDAQGSNPVSAALATGHAAIGLEVRRAEAAVADALVWAIAWDPESAADRAFAEAWLTWVRSDAASTDAEVSGVAVERLTDTASGIEQLLVMTSGLALVLSDVGGGEDALAVVIGGLGG